MPGYQSYGVVGPDGEEGTMFASSRFLDESEQRLLTFKDGREFLVPKSEFIGMPDGSYRLRLTETDLERFARTGSARLPLATPAGAATPLPTPEKDPGIVSIHKTVGTSETVVDEPLFQEDYDIQRVAINRVVDGPVSSREEGDTLILPVFEEVLVVEKRCVLREEVRITKKREEKRDPQTVTLRRENIEVEHLTPGA